MYFDPVSAFMFVLGLAALGGLVAHLVLKAPAGSVGTALRKAAPYLLFLLLGLAALSGPLLFPHVVGLFYHAAPATGPAASGAEIAAGQQAGGWVPSGTVASKFITFAGAYLLAVLVPWLVQHLTHPAPTRWAKTRYSGAFLALSYQEQFTVYGRLQLVIVIRATAALLFAALVV